MKNHKNAFFYFNKTERRGAFALLISCLLLFVFPRLWSNLFRTSAEADFSAFRQAILEWDVPADTASSVAVAAQLDFFDPNSISFDEILRYGVSERAARTLINFREKVGPFRTKEDLRKLYNLTASEFELLDPFIRIDAPKQERKENKRQAPVLAELFFFDPNTVSGPELHQLGISERTAKSILNYREKGGRFKRPEDLEKIYTLSEEDFTRLAPFIRIAETAPGLQTIGVTLPAKPGYKSKMDHGVQPILDINTATPEEWTQLRGIGPAFSKRIVNFREKLGGFINPEQVGETFGLPDSTFQKIKPQLKGSPLLRYVQINRATIEEIKNHPYLDSKKATAIVRYREQHGPFGSIEDVKKVLALPPDVIEKMRPYLSYD